MKYCKQLLAASAGGEKKNNKKQQQAYSVTHLRLVRLGIGPRTADVSPCYAARIILLLSKNCSMKI